MRLKLSSIPVVGKLMLDGLAEAEGDIDVEGETDADALALGETDGLVEALGESEGLEKETFQRSVNSSAIFTLLIDKLCKRLHCFHLCNWLGWIRELIV